MSIARPDWLSRIGGLAAGTEHDQVSVTGTGTATLGGTLSASLINGFVPTDGDSFTLMTFTSRSGVFSSTSLPPPGGGLQWNLSYGATSVVLGLGQAILPWLTPALTQASANVIAALTGSITGT